MWLKMKSKIENCKWCTSSFVIEFCKQALSDVPVKTQESLKENKNNRVTSHVQIVFNI
jgi:hypothetical protein